MNKLYLLALATATLTLTGCMTPIGKEEFTCENVKKGGVCEGPRRVYELTNNRENLNEYADAMREKQQANKNKPKRKQTDGYKESLVQHTHHAGHHHNHNAVSNDDVVVYEARAHAQNTSSGYQPARVVPQSEFENASRDGFDAFPGNGEPLAPEPLAIVNPPKIMRILVASYTDEQGRLNMPGYVYVQVNEQTFSVGEAANLRPTRVVPLEVRNKSQEEERKQQQRSKGVSPLEVVSGGK